MVTRSGDDPELTPEGTPPDAPSWSLEALLRAFAAAIAGHDGPIALEAAADIVLESLVTTLGVSYGFIRHNDREAGETILVREWPVRTLIPVPDPFFRVKFKGSEPAFAETENLKEPTITRPERVNARYRRRTLKASGLPYTTALTAPILRRGITIGVIGLIAVGNHVWLLSEEEALVAIAQLLSDLSLGD